MHQATEELRVGGDPTQLATHDQAILGVISTDMSSGSRQGIAAATVRQSGVRYSFTGTWSDLGTDISPLSHLIVGTVRLPHRELIES